MVRLDFVPSILGLCLGPLSSASGFAHLELFPSVHSSSHPDASPLLSGFGSFDASPSLHSSCRMGSVVPVLGLACFGLVFLLLVMENVQLESFLFSQAPAWMESMALILDLISIELTTPLRQLAWLEPVVSILGIARFDLSVSLLSMSLFEPSLPSQSLSQADAFIFILDLFHVDLPVFLHSFTCFDSSSSISSCISSDLSPSFRSVSHLGVPSPALGTARCGSVSSPSVVAVAHLGASSSLRSPARLEVLLPVAAPWKIIRGWEAADFFKNEGFCEKWCAQKGVFFFRRYFPTKLCGVLVFRSAPRPASSSSASPPSPCHIQPCHIHNFVTHNFVTHNFVTYNFVTYNLVTYTTLSHTTLSHTTLSHTTLSHTTLSHTQLCHTQLCHLQPCHTQLCHIQLCHIQLCHNFVTTCHTQLCHIHIVTYNFVTYNLVTHNFVTYTLSHTHWRGTWRHPPSFRVADVLLMGLGWPWWRAWAPWRRGTFCVAGVALGDICLRFTWQAWHLATSNFVLRGRRGTYGAGLALVARLGAVTPRLFYVADAALGDIYLRFAWQCTLLSSLLL